MNDLKMFIPMCKVDEEKRLVYGIATQEVKDKSDETMDYESSKPLFSKWSQDIEKASGGKSLGNLREMHSNKAAGKLTQLDFNDENKAVEVCAKVVDEESWSKVLEGVLTGFSIGGSYAKRWKDEEGNTRFTADPAEISLVDNPCCPTATFEVIKANGITEQREFKHTEVEKLENEINKSVLDDFKKALADKDLAKAFSFEEIKDRIRGALGEKINTPFNAGYFWIMQTYPDSVIIEGDLDGDGDNDMYQIPYTMTEDGVVTVDVANAKQVKVSYVPTVDESGETESLKAAKPEDLEKTAKSDEAKKDNKEQNPEDENNKSKENKEEPKKEDAEKSAVPDDLEKAGAKHSKDTVSTLQKMAHDLNALGGACKCDKCMKMYGANNDQTAKAAENADLNKSQGNNDEESELTKAMKGLSDLQKAFDGLKSENEALSKSIEELKNQPLPGGAIFSSNDAVINKSLSGDEQPQGGLLEIDELAAWETIINKSNDPQVQQNARVQKAQILMKRTLGSR